MAKTVTLSELRAQAAEQRAAWAKIPVADILMAVSNDIKSDEIQRLILEIRPLYEALPEDEPSRQAIGSLINLLTQLPTVITQRLDQLAKS